VKTDTLATIMLLVSTKYGIQLYDYTRFTTLQTIDKWKTSMVTCCIAAPYRLGYHPQPFEIKLK